jgi:uncharacterized protein (DUF1015 family)
MPRISPFRGLRYAVPPAPDLSTLFAPPYDVIGPEDRRRLAAHPRNIVHLELPEGGDAAPAAARRSLDTWRRDGTLASDPIPAFYVAEQEFTGRDGAARRRRGFFARLTLEPYESGVVLPHERTLDGPRRERTRLLQATRAGLSPVFMLHPDPDGAVTGLLARHADAPPVAWATDAKGVRARLFRIDDAASVAAIADRLAPAWALIADGHHRYESALAYQADRRTAGRDDAGHLLVFLASLADPGLEVLPIHRVAHSLASFDAQRLRAALGAWFDLEAIADRARLGAAVAAAAGRSGVFGLTFAGEPGAWVARWRDGAGLDSPVMAELPAALRRLDVVLLHRLVLESALGIDAARLARQENLDYLKEAGPVLDLRPGAQMGMLLNPTRLEQVIEVSRGGLRLPQKSTNFSPKVPAGLVIDLLDDPPPAASSS